MWKFSGNKCTVYTQKTKNSCGWVRTFLFEKSPEYSFTFVFKWQCNANEFFQLLFRFCLKIATFLIFKKNIKYVRSVKNSIMNPHMPVV